jgi:hypothetical protein
VKSHFLGKIHETLAPVDAREIAVPDDAAPCPAHPAWRPVRHLPTQPRESAERCPYCLDEKRREDRRLEEQIRNLPSLDVHQPHLDESPYKSERALRAIAAWRERRENSGQLIPGTPEWHAACDLLQARHEEEMKKDRRKSGRGGVVLFSHIENGVLVDFVDMRSSIRDRPNIVRVGP